MKAELYKWLKDIDKIKEAAFLYECSVNLVYVDTLFELGGGETMTDLMDAQIGVPGKYFLKLQSVYQSEVKVIEEQLSEVATAIGMHIRQIT